MKKSKILFGGLYIAILCVVVFSCKTTKTTTSNNCKITPTYTADIVPVIKPGCGCHMSGKTPGHVDLSNYESVKEEAVNGKMMGAIEQLDGFTPMPKNHPKLADSTIQMIQCWVSTGAKE